MKFKKKKNKKPARTKAVAVGIQRAGQMGEGRWRLRTDRTPGGAVKGTAQDPEWVMVPVS